MLKNLSITLAILCLIGTASVASAHGVLSSQEKEVGNYKVSMEVTADAGSIYEDYPITYAFRLMSKDGTKEIPYDSAYVTFSNKAGGYVFSAQVVGPQEFLPGAQLDAAMPDPGEYKAEIIFLIPKGSSGESDEVNAEFDYSVQKGEAESGASQSAQSSEDSAGLPGYAWAVIVLVIGIVLGRFGGKIFGSLKS